jgi:hypothetical protein
MFIHNFKSFPILARNLLNISKKLNNTIQIDYHNLSNKTELFGTNKVTKLLKNQRDRFDYDIFYASNSEFIYHKNKETHKYIEACEFHNHLQSKKKFILYKLDIYRNETNPYVNLITEKISDIDIKLFIGDIYQEFDIDFWDNLPKKQQNLIKEMEYIIEKNFENIKIIE